MAVGKRVVRDIGQDKPPSDSDPSIWKPVSPRDMANRVRLLKLWVQLESEYATWRVTHQDIIDYCQPNHGQFYAYETNKGTRKDVKVINNTANDRARKLSAAMDTGICSEAREWFTVSTENPLDAEDPGNREYCHEFQDALFNFIAKVGFYAPNRNALDDCVGPAIGLVLIEEDDKSMARCTHVPIGQYRAAADSRGEVNLVIRRFLFTAAQMAQEFGEENVSPGCRLALKQEITQSAKFQVLHIIEERSEREHGKIDAKNKPWSSTWMEIGAGYWSANVMGQTDVQDPLGPAGILRESGYDEQPFYCMRWNQIGQNAYGTDSPGWTVLGDTKSLQDLELGGATLAALIMKPPMNQPTDLKNASLLPGAMNPIANNSKAKFEPSFTVLPDSITVVLKQIAALEGRINAGMYGDILFLLSADQRVQPRTAEEIRGKKEERLLQLGGVFARIATALRIAIIRMASIAHRLNLLPQPPPALMKAGGKLKIDFVNPLITAQKAIGVQAVQELVSFGLAAAQAKQGGFDKLDLDEACDSVADMLGVAPKMLLTDEAVAQQRQAAAAQANAQQQAESMAQAAPAIKDLSSVDPEKLQQTLSRFGPNAQAEGAGPGA